MPASTIFLQISAETPLAPTTNTRADLILNNAKDQFSLTGMRFAAPQKQTANKQNINSNKQTNKRKLSISNR